VVQKTLDYITESLAKGDKVRTAEFWRPLKVQSPPRLRVGRNPNKPETDVPIPARSMVKFKAGKGNAGRSFEAANVESLMPNAKPSGKSEGGFSDLLFS